MLNNHFEFDGLPLRYAPGQAAAQVERYAGQMNNIILLAFILLITVAPAYSWQCLDDAHTSFSKAESAYVIKVSSKIDLQNEEYPDEKKVYVKYKVLEVLKGAQRNKEDEVIDTIGLIPDYVDFEVGYYYILFLEKSSVHDGSHYVNMCSVHAKSQTLDDKYFINVLKEMRLW